MTAFGPDSNIDATQQFRLIANGGTITDAPRFVGCTGRKQSHNNSLVV
jgi:hypothetical protein